MNVKICSNKSCQKSLEKNNEIYQCQKCENYFCSNKCLKEHKIKELSIKIPNSTRNKNHIKLDYINTEQIKNQKYLFTNKINFLSKSLFIKK